MIPMINIVFLLLVFYLVAGQIERTYGGDIEPPTSDSEKALEDASVTLALAANGAISLNDRPIKIESLDAETLTVGGGLDRVLVKADRRAKAADLDRLLRALRARDISTITLFSRPAHAAPGV